MKQKKAIQSKAGTSPAITKKSWRKLGIRFSLLIIVLIIGFPLIYTFAISTQNLQEVIARPNLKISNHALENFQKAWGRSNTGRLLYNSLFVALVSTLGKIIMAILSAFATVFFDFRFKSLAFWTIFITLMLPVPVRIVSTYQVISNLDWLSSYMGLTVPSFSANFITLFPVS